MRGGKLIIPPDSGSKYLREWQKRYKRLGKPSVSLRAAEAETDGHHSSLNLILAMLGAYGERMRRKAELGELGEFPLPMKCKKNVMKVWSKDEGRFTASSAGNFISS